MNGREILKPGLGAAAAHAMRNPQTDSQVVKQTANVTMPLDGLSRLVECGVLTPHQLFNLIFKNHPPQDFRGVADHQEEPKAMPASEGDQDADCA